MVVSITFFPPGGGRGSGPREVACLKHGPKRAQGVSPTPCAHVCNVPLYSGHLHHHLALISFHSFFCKRRRFYIEKQQNGSSFLNFQISYQSIEFDVLANAQRVGADRPVRRCSSFWIVRVFKIQILLSSYFI